MIRDGASMVGGLLFTTFSSANFGQNVKAWRLFADYINNIGITLDLLAPLSQNLFLPLICMSSVFKALCGIAAGATGSVISEHWGSLNGIILALVQLFHFYVFYLHIYFLGNTAEVNSKNGAQHTAISLIGLLLSLPFTAIACRTPAIMWTVYTFLTVLHMVSNYIAMRTLRLRSINISRAKLLTQFFLEIMTPHLPADLKKQGIITENLYDVIKKHSKLFSTEYIASIEPILSLLILPMFKRINTKFKSKSGFQVAVMPDSLIHMWASPSEVFDHFRQLKIPSDDLQNMFSQMTNENKKGYALLYNSLSGSSNQEIFVCFSNKCTSQDQLLALLEANIILRFKTINLQDLNQLHRELSPLFLKCLEGWDFNRILLRTPNALAYST